MFSATSRYFSFPTATYETPQGGRSVSLRRRRAPQPEQLAWLEEHTVALGERLDTIAGARLGDPEQFWRICDANRALRPEERTAAVGRRLRITLPQGVPGAPDS